MKRNRHTVLITGMLLQLCAGIIYMWSVFKGPVSDHLDWSSTAAAYTSSIMLTSFVVGILFGGRLQDRIGPVYAATTADNFGTKHASANFGTVMVAFGLSIDCIPNGFRQHPCTLSCFYSCSVLCCGCFALCAVLSANFIKTQLE